MQASSPVLCAISTGCSPSLVLKLRAISEWHQVHLNLRVPAPPTWQLVQ